MLKEISVLLNFAIELKIIPIANVPNESDEN